MQYNEFPYSIKEKLNMQTGIEIKPIMEEQKNAINRLEESFKDVWNGLVLQQSGFKFESEWAGFAEGGLIIGLVVGVFICFRYGDILFDGTSSAGDSLGYAIMFWFMCGIVGAILAIILSYIISRVKSNSDKVIDSKLTEEKQAWDQKIAAEKQKYDEIIRKTKEDAENIYEVYLNGFNNEAQKMSVYFADSSVAKEVIEWMTNGFCKTILAADRRSHIEQIQIPFMFKVFRNKIECNLGTYDFEVKRCDELQTPLEQTALSRAIAAAIQLNIAMKYPKDVSGTNVVVNISYEYKQDYVITTIIYIALNGNYRTTRGWMDN